MNEITIKATGEADMVSASNGSMNVTIPIKIIRRGRRKADTAIAHHHCCDPVPRRRRHFRIPGRLAIIMGVDVDKAGRDDQPLGVNLLAPRSGNGAHGRDAATIDGDIAGEAWIAAAINDGAAADHEIMHGQFLLRKAGRMPDQRCSAILPHAFARLRRHTHVTPVRAL